MSEYRLSILVEGADRGARDILLNLHSGLGALNVALGTLVADGLKAAAGALVEFGRQGLSVATDYQSSLNMFQAVSGAGADEMARIAAEAKRLGADMTLPATSAGDAAKAMTELAKAGLSVNNALAAGKGTLQLAAAGAIDEAQAAEIAANALNSFGLSGDKATMVADLFAAAANKSSVEVTDVADSFKMASAVFSAFQGPVVGAEGAMKDLTTAIALLGNVGIKGSDAGTSLKQMLLQLTGPSGVAKDQMKGLMFAAMGATGSMEGLDKIIGGKAKDRTEALKALGAANPDIAAMGDIAYDAAGNMRPLQEIIKLVTAATKDMNDEQRNQALTTIFGADATRAIIGLMKAGPEAFNEMQAAISAQGAAADLAGARMKGLGGAWEGFKSTLETAQLSVMEPLLGPLETGVRALAEALAAATPGMTAFVTTAVVPAVTAFAEFLSALIAAPDKVSFLAMQLSQTLAGAFGVSIADAAGFVGGIIGAATAIGRFIGAFIEAPDKMAFFKDQLSGVKDFVVGWSDELLTRGRTSIDGFASSLVAGIEERGPAILNGFLAWRQSAIEWIAGAAPGALQALGEQYLGPMLDWLGARAADLVPILGAWGARFVDWVIAASPGLFRELLGLSGQMFGWISERVPGIAAKLGEWALAFIEWVGPATGRLIVAIGGMLGTLLSYLYENRVEIIKTLNEWKLAVGEWFVTEFGPAVLRSFEGLITTIDNEIAKLWNNAFSDGSLGKAFVDDLIRGAEAAWGSFTSWLSNNWQETLKNIPALGSIISSGQAAGIPGFASGVRNFRGGLALVGERGPELAMLPGGTSILPNGATGSFLAGASSAGGSGGLTWTGNLIVQGASDPQATARAVREELIRMRRRVPDLGFA